MVKSDFEYLPRKWAIGWILCLGKYFLSIFLGPFTFTLYIPRMEKDNPVSDATPSRIGRTV